MDNLSAVDWEQILSKTRKSAQTFEKQLTPAVNCPFCLDAKHVYIHYEWYYWQEIPDEAEVEWLDIGLGPGRIAVPCDCHPGRTGENGEHRPVKTFADFFGAPVQYHHWGQKLKAYRQARSGDNGGYTAEGNIHELPAF